MRFGPSTWGILFTLGCGTGAKPPGSGDTATATGGSPTGTTSSAGTATGSGTTPGGTTPGGTTPTGTAGTGDTAAPAVFSARCDRAGAHPLVVRCAVQRSPAGPVTVRLTADGVAVREVVDDVSGSGGIVVPFLHADTTYAWTVSTDGHPDATGEVTTGTPPDSLRPLLEQSGVPLADRFVTSTPCDGVENGESHLIVVDTAPLAVTWYGGFEADDDPMQVRWTRDGTLAGLTFFSHVKEWAVDGTVLADFIVPDPHLHHDLEIADGLVYALWQESGLGPEERRIDQGFAVYDRSGSELARWAFADVLVTPDGAEDWTHVNGIEVLDDGDVLLSLRHQSAVVRVSGTPGAADFGAVRWWLTGEPSAVITSDFELVGDGELRADFRYQHDAQILADGSLLMFDNRTRSAHTPVSEPSRALRLELDVLGGVARAVEEWQLDAHCSFSGSARPLDDGGVLLACAPRWEVTGFASSDAPPPWSLTVSCDSGLTAGWVKRVTPL